MEQQEARDQEKTWAQMEDDRMVAFLFESRGKAKHRTGMTGSSTSCWWVIKGWREVTPMSSYNSTNTKDHSIDFLPLFTLLNLSPQVQGVED